MKITTSLVMAGRYKELYKDDKNIVPKFGRCWFFYFPHINYNRGKFWKNEVTDLGFVWLFWVFNLTIWGNNKRKDNGTY